MARKGGNNLFEIVVKLKDDWIDFSGISETELFKALSDWSSGKEAIIKIKSFSFKSEDILNILVSR
jgi:hypothetical protein